MNTFDLQTLGLEEMNEEDIKNVEGGWMKEIAFFLHEAVFQWGFAAGQEDRAR